MRKLLLNCFFIVLSLSANAQFAPDFNITDSNGNEHNLYTDYLDQGKTVVIKLFFVGCPPCTAIAPDFQEMYVNWGEGNMDVQFIELSTQVSNTDMGINNYLNGLNVTVPASGDMGGGYEASEPYRTGEFGTYWGTPGFAVIAPDRNVVYFKSTTNLTEVHNAILDTGAEPLIIIEEPDPTEYNFNFIDALGNSVDNVDVVITDANPSNNTSYTINTNSINEIEILNFEEDYPGIDTPVFRFEKNGPAKDDLSVIDLLTIQRHILELATFTNPDLLIAADANSNGSISVIDLITIQRIILGLATEFPGGAETWIIKDNDIPVLFSPGNTINIDVELIQRGNVR